MKARDFIKHRAKIIRQHHTEAKRQAAMHRLVRDSRAVVIVIAKQAVGWRLPSGDVVCALQRYRDQAAAESAMGYMAATNFNSHRIPRRAYQCMHCCGWHLTSRA